MKFSITDRILILGESGSGKTYLARRIVSVYPRVVVFDPAGDWSPRPGMQVVHDIRPEALSDITEMVLREGNVLLVLDDLDVLVTKWHLWQDPILRYLFIASRHRRVGWVVISRRVADIPTLILKQANKLCLFQTDLPHDLRLFDEYVSYGVSERIRGLNRLKYEFLYVDRDQKRFIVSVAR